jgi:hypothetical protein
MKRTFNRTDTAIVRPDSKMAMAARGQILEACLFLAQANVNEAQEAEDALSRNEATVEAAIALNTAYRNYWGLNHRSDGRYTVGDWEANLSRLALEINILFAANASGERAGFQRPDFPKRRCK